MGGMVDGMASRVDRLKAIGNGQVPLCAKTAWELLK
jgi:DNA (cytosine-5)-methyltransferase 1